MPGHPTGTKCRPDIVAVMQSPKIGPGKLHWSHVHATGEEESSDKTDQERESQAGGYTAYHLQARPGFRVCSRYTRRQILFQIVLLQRVSGVPYRRYHLK
jgi:hypothetical protein